MQMTPFADLLFLGLPVLVFFAWLQLFTYNVSSIRERILIALAWFTLFLVFITEVLSAFDALTRWHLAVAWLLVGTLVWVIGRWLNGPRPAVVLPEVTAKPARWTVGGLRVPAKTFVVCGVLIAALLGVTAIGSPPNGWDVSQYHMPRVVEWQGQHSIRFFPTNYYVQLFAPPLTEWAMLHTYILAGNDRFVNLVNWLAFLACALAVTSIAQEFGLGRFNQFLTALFCMTLPQGVLGASGAKNDWMVSLWLTVAVLMCLRYERKAGWLYALTFGIAVGATVLSKGSGYVFGPPIIGSLLLFRPARWKRRKAIEHMVAASIIVLVMNTPQWARNYQLANSDFRNASARRRGTAEVHGRPYNHKHGGSERCKRTGGTHW